MKSLYVGNLPWSTTEAELTAEFGKHGEVQGARLVMDKLTGKSRGFGFVDMTDDTAAQNAITALNGFRWGDREITVNEARPKTDRRDSGNGGGRDSRGPRRYSF